jgi:hypothetical protein
MVTRAQFASALTMCGLSLLPEELDLLNEKYQSVTKAGHVKWLVFADAMDEVWNPLLAIWQWVGGIQNYPSCQMHTPISSGTGSGCRFFF